MCKPNFFIVGAPKCGTTAMHGYLRRHPDVFMPANKEPCFFCDDLRPAGFRPDLDAYLALFDGAGDLARLGESSTWYLFSEVAAERIKQFAPDARIIAMLRNPVDMLYSLHSQMRFNGDPLPDFAEAIATEDQRLREYLADEDDRANKGLKLRTVFHTLHRYSEQLRRYLDAFGPGRVHVIIFDDFARDPARAYRSVLAFLGVDPQFETDYEVVNANKAVRSRRARALMQATPLWLRRTVDALIGRRNRRRISGSLKSFNATRRTRTPMAPQLRRRLQKRFASEVAELGDLLGRDLTGWCTGAGGD